MAHGVDP